MRKLAQYLLLAAIALAFIGLVFFIRLLTSPRVSVLRESPFSWANAVETGFLFLLASVVVLSLKLYFEKKFGSRKDHH